MDNTLALWLPFRFTLPATLIAVPHPPFFSAMTYRPPPATQLPRLAHETEVTAAGIVIVLRHVPFLSTTTNPCVLWARLTWPPATQSPARAHETEVALL